MFGSLPGAKSWILRHSGAAQVASAPSVAPSQSSSRALRQRSIPAGFTASRVSSQSIPVPKRQDGSPLAPYPSPSASTQFVGSTTREKVSASVSTGPPSSEAVTVTG